ncbi:hypothetical protein LINPERHAP1_LOCUS22887 [Linum perenne]
MVITGRQRYENGWCFLSEISEKMKHLILVHMPWLIWMACLIDFSSYALVDFSSYANDKLYGSCLQSLKCRECEIEDRVRRDERD